MRKPAAAGSCYPGSFTGLQRQIEDCFKHPLGPGALPGEGKPADRRVDSPLAVNATEIFEKHAELFNEKFRRWARENGNPFSRMNITYLCDVQDSMKLNELQEPCIILSASGMAEAGRIRHHIKNNNGDDRNTILIVGYMAQHTLGRRILEEGLEYEESGRKGTPPLLRFLNKYYPLNAQVVKLGGFRALADKNELHRFLKESNLKIKKIALVHGEEEQKSLLLPIILQLECYHHHCQTH